VTEKRYLRSGELAQLAGVSTDSLRHYERLRLLPVPRRSPANYRMYPLEALARVQMIRRALAIGFSLPELAKILKVRDGGGTPCRQVKRLLEDKLSQLDAKIGDLVALRQNLRIVVKDWDERLSKTPDGVQAKLLESLVPPVGAG
jgi:DNA-binding transcriptional MerR regulator